MFSKLLHWPFLRRRESLSSKISGYLFLFAVLIAGSTFTSFAKVLTTAFSPISLLFIGESMILMFVFLSFGAIRIVKELSRLRTKDIPPLIVLSIFATSGLILLFSGLETTKAANAELFTRVELIFLITLAAIFLKEPFKREHIIGGGVMALGILLVALRGFREELTFYPGDILIIFGGLGFSIAGIIFKKYLSHIQPELALFFRSSTSLVIFFSLSPFVEHTLIEEMQAFDMSMIGALIGYGLISRFINILCFYESAKRLQITKIAFILPFGIIIAIFFANVYLGETLYWFHFFGATLIILGNILVHLIGFSSKKEHIETHLKQHHRHNL